MNAYAQELKSLRGELAPDREASWRKQSHSSSPYVIAKRCLRPDNLEHPPIRSSSFLRNECRDANQKSQFVNRKLTAPQQRTAVSKCKTRPIDRVQVVTDQGLACTWPQAPVNPEPTAQEPGVTVSIVPMEDKNVHAVADSRVNSSTASKMSALWFSNCIRISARKVGKAIQWPAPRQGPAPSLDITRDQVAAILTVPAGATFTCGEDP